MLPRAGQDRGESDRCFVGGGGLVVSDHEAAEAIEFAERSAGLFVAEVLSTGGPGSPVRALAACETASDTGTDPSASSRTSPAVAGVSRRAARTCATSSRVTSPTLRSAVRHTPPVPGPLVEGRGTQDGPVEVLGHEVLVGDGLGMDVGGPDLIGVGRGRAAGPRVETITYRRTPARRAASARRTEAWLSTVCLRAAPLPGPAPAAKTTASAPDRTGTMSSHEAVSRSRTTGCDAVRQQVPRWAGLRMIPATCSPGGEQPQPPGDWPWPPAITIS